MNKKQKKKQDKKYNKRYNILIVIVALIIFAYIIYAIVNLIKSPTDVFVIEYGKVALEEPTVGYLIREETVVKGDNYQNGIITIKSEGEKIAKGEAMFRYYSDNEQTITQQIEEIDKKINEALENQTDIFSSDIKSLDKQIEQRVKGISQYTDIEKIREYKNDINTYLSKKSKIAGENSASGSYIKQLYEEKSKYESQLNQSNEYVNAPVSGVVSYRVDNLENVLTPSDFSKINKDLLESLNLKTGQIVATDNQQGKVINNYKCYIATVMNTENAIGSKERSKSKNKIS